MIVILHIAGIEPKPVEVADLAAASRAVLAFQDAEGMGASDMGDWHGLVKDGGRTSGRVVARVSYNGRVWNDDSSSLVMEAAAPARKRPARRPRKVRYFNVMYNWGGEFQRICGGQYSTWEAAKAEITATHAKLVADGESPPRHAWVEAFEKDLRTGRVEQVEVTSRRRGRR